MKERVIAAPQTASLGDVLDFMRLIWALDHGLQTTSRRMESTHGVTGPQRLAIRMIGKFPGMNAGALARLLFLHPSTVTGILKRLERKGFLIRRPDPQDRRRALFGLTAKGNHMAQDGRGTVESAVQDVLTLQDASTLDAVRQVLAALAARIEETGR